MSRLPRFAHHGFGRFDRTKPVEIKGVIKSIDFVNPHSYLNLDVIGPDGKAIAMRCEMRAATLLRRSGWSEEMFVTGAQAKIFGFGHRDDPAACYLEDITIGDAPKRNRNDQFEHTTSVDYVEPAEAPPVGRAEHLGRLGAGAVRDRRAAERRRQPRAEEPDRGRRVGAARDEATCRRRAGARGP